MTARLPVITGVAQLTTRTSDVAEPVDSMTEVTRMALDDSAGVPVDRVGLIGVVGGLWEYRDPGRLIAERLGADGARTLLTGFGGQTPQALLGRTADRIAAGELDVAVVVGGEAVATRRALRADGGDMTVTDQTGAEPDERFTPSIDVTSDEETSMGLIMPVQTYAIMEVALRHARGESNESHISRIAQMWANMSKTAAKNPHAWHREPMTASEIATPSKDNRLVGYPYTRRMNAEPSVDMAAAVVVMAESIADECGVDEERRVYPHMLVEASDTTTLAERPHLDGSGAIAAIGATLSDLGAPTIGDIAHLDLYSCFPSIVQITCDALGIDEDRHLTQTGGLHFGGGPLNNSVTHSLAAMVEALRADPGAVGLIQANGGLATKHAIGTYSTERPDAFMHVDAHDRIDTSEHRQPLDTSESGEFTLEAYTVMHDRDGPTGAVAALLDEPGRRGWARSVEPDVFAALMAEDLVGTTVHRCADATLRL